MYFNYHAKAKRKIEEGKLLHYEIVDNWNGICPALILYFSDCPPMPIRENHFDEYFELLEKIKF